MRTVLPSQTRSTRAHSRPGRGVGVQLGVGVRVTVGVGVGVPVAVGVGSAGWASAGRAIPKQAAAHGPEASKPMASRRAIETRAGTAELARATAVTRPLGGEHPLDFVLE